MSDQTPSAGLSELLAQQKGKSIDEVIADMNRLPFFMTEMPPDGEENIQVEALKALAYEGDPDEVAQNFREQGNECFRAHKYKDAAEYYTKALDVECKVPAIDAACYGNRAQCNLELKNYRNCIRDCTKVLEIDDKNAKAWFRSAKAFQLLDKIDEALKCCDLGLAACPGNDGILSIKEKCEKRKETLARLEQARKERAAKARAKANALKQALDSRGITRMYTEEIEDKRKTAGDLKVQLEDELRPGSSLYLPVLFLYPLVMESDVFESVEESSTIGSLLTQLFEQPPPWADRHPGYSLGNLEVYVPISRGGLAKVGLKSSIAKALGTTKPDLTMVDGMARFYVVPKNLASDWLSTWKPEHQKLYPEY